ncbi:MAG: hypothetical protein ACRDMV_19650 [Streptosporangiales bacterium]
MTSLPEPPPAERALHTARAAVLHDLTATGHTDPGTVSLLDHAVSDRRWWVGEWPAGAPYATALVAQDVVDGLLERVGRWPCCPMHAEEPLVVEPPLGEDPSWVCAQCGPIATVGGLDRT